MTTQSRTGNVVFVIALLVIFTGLAGIVLLANNYRNLNTILSALGLPTLISTPVSETTNPVPEITEPPDPVIPIPDRMMELPIAPPQKSFRKTITRGRDDICASLQKAGWVNENWQLGELGVQTWNCSAEQILTTTSDPVETAGTLFVTARGLTKDRVSSIRLKVNFVNGDTSGPVLEAALSAIQDIFTAIGWGEDAEILTKLRRLEPFELTGNGNTITFAPEFGGVPRYNFLIVSDPPGVVANDGARYGRKKWLKSPDLDR